MTRCHTWLGKRTRLSSGVRAVVEQAAVERRQREDVRPGHRQLLLCHRPTALRHQREEPPQRLVEIEAVARLRRVQRRQLEIAQRLQAVALEVDLAFAIGT